MKKYLIIAALTVLSLSARAQLFDFSSNSGRFESGFTIGQAASFTDYANFGTGINFLGYGVYVDFLYAAPQHMYDSHVNDTKWNDTEAYCISAGYQVPILPWLRVMPVAGYMQTNEGVTDASTINIKDGENTATFYHDYDVTPGTRIHYFNYGLGLSIQPCKWFSINAIATRYALYGGIGINLTYFAKGE